MHKSLQIPGPTSPRFFCVETVQFTTDGRDNSDGRVYNCQSSLIPNTKISLIANYRNSLYRYGIWWIAQISLWAHRLCLRENTLSGEFFSPTSRFITYSVCDSVHIIIEFWRTIVDLKLDYKNTPSCATEKSMDIVPIIEIVVGISRCYAAQY